MTDYDNDSEKRTAVSNHAAVIGYDQRGRCHRWDPVRATLSVTVDGDVVHTEELARPAVQHWIDYVREEKCGWIDEWWNAETPAHDRHQAAKAQAADIRYNLAKDAAQEATA
ncbi:hypothetical protein ACFR9U_04605 [Halorientalis brevis]|uniref:Uncharacterized protein n=1 Tax=Halorientalis brevis TaxID=1126241 RepID=A0ABD6C879_9EURY|nr:hypothetical protein [Halorientalis brevis]